MTNAGQPPTIEERLSRLENLFTNMGETVLAHDVLYASFLRYILNRKILALKELVAESSLFKYKLA